MKNGRIYEDLSLIGGRAHKTFNVFVVLFIILLLCFWKIQILDHEKYWKKSEANRVREIVLPAQRGLITTRNSEIIANNIASFKVSIIRENCKNIDESCQKIAQLLNLEVSVLKERINRYESLPAFVPIVVKDNLSRKEVSIVESRRLEFPELIIQAEPKRYYPYGIFASHVIGYLQEPSLKEIKMDIYREMRIGDLVGKIGIEKEYEAKLKGEEGRVIEIVDSLGKKKDEIARLEPLKGQNIMLTLDFDLQKKAEELLEGNEGSIVILDPRAGEILALASYPNFDPNKFINRFTPTEWIELINNPEFPLENRAIRGLYSPGSIFKLVIALAALDLNIITDRTLFFCSGNIVIYGHLFSCWFKLGHGNIDLYNGIRHSCNIYFYQLGKRLGIEEISVYARMLGYGMKTGIDLSGEKDGLVPDPDWKERVRNAPWYPGETISVSIGQGPLLTTPLQVAYHTAIIANRGRKITPHLLMSDNSISSEREGQEWVPDKMLIKIKKSVFEKVIKGMWKAVNENGTARAARIDGYDVCGKTGSTQTVSKETSEKLEKEVKTHSWFTGFAPKSDPKVVITVLVEYGGLGGATAAPIANKLFDLYRKKYD